MSAPTVDESPHDHPHDDAVKLYVDHVGDEANMLHTGKARETIFFDIRDDGTASDPQTDDGKLAEKYGLDKDDDGGGDDGGGGDKKAENRGPFVRPTGPSEPTPKKYARTTPPA